jgi:hypothetical protein
VTNHRDDSGTQAPVAQISLAAHVLPQAPQLEPSVWVVTQLPLQRVHPAAHVAAHVEELHVDVAFATAGHPTPHAPQFCGSLERSTHELPHVEKPG